MSHGRMRNIPDDVWLGSVACVVLSNETPRYRHSDVVSSLLHTKSSQIALNKFRCIFGSKPDQIFRNERKNRTTHHHFIVSHIHTYPVPCPIRLPDQTLLRTSDSLSTSKDSNINSALTVRFKGRLYHTYLHVTQ